VLVLTNAYPDDATEFGAACAFVADRLNSVAINLGPAAEVLVAQCAEDGATPMVDLLRNAPAAFRRLFALFGERAEYRFLLGPEPASPAAVRAFIEGLRDQAAVERETFLLALDATRQSLAALARETAFAKSELERMQIEYFGRLDTLTAKLSTSAARYTRELTLKDEMLTARERQAEQLAGEAAEAQRKVAELLSSSSWRMTAPIRLLVRIANSRREKPPGQPTA